jgi:hypothetical protein
MLEESEDRLLRADLYELENRLDSIEAKLACLPTLRNLGRIALSTVLSGAAIVLFGMATLIR